MDPIIPPEPDDELKECHLRLQFNKYSTMDAKKQAPINHGFGLTSVQNKNDKSPLSQLKRNEKRKVI